MKLRIALVVLSIASVARAQDPPIEDIPPGDDKITPVAAGEKAPYSGQLFDSSTALRWANWLQQYRARLKQDVELEQRFCTIKLEYDTKVLAAEKERNTKVESDLRERLGRSEQARLNAEEELRNPPFYKSTWFGIVTGVVGTATVFGLSVYALDQTRN